jgi:alpha-galactosidase
MNTLKFKKYKLTYLVENKLKTILQAQFDRFENEDMVLEFLIADHNAENTIIYKTNLEPKQKIQLQSFEITAEIDYKNTFGIFCNGFQSWTESKVFYKNNVIKPAKKFLKGIAYTYGDYNFTHYAQQKGVVHSWNYTYIKQEKNNIQLLASLDESKAYTCFEHWSNNNLINIKREVENVEIEHTFELLHIALIEDREAFAFEQFNALQTQAKTKEKPAIGWTSWYHYYTKIDEQIILKNLNNFVERKIPIQIFQIDDGWQKAVGDWLNIQPKFKNGMRILANEIKKNNIVAGLWLAPFACEKNSFIYKEKQDWILKNKQGELVKIGYNPEWSGWFYALDFFNAEVRNYVQRVFKTILDDWNFDLVKLDFLYGVASIPQHGKSRSEVMHLVMQFLRTCVGNKKILGCGVPLTAAAYQTDFCRIGPDIHLSWEFKVLQYLGARERLSTYSAIHNTISRRHLNKIGFINDPDVFILRKEKNKLSFNEQYCLLLANVLFGDLLFNSDDISTYDASTLFLYQSIFPLVKKENILVQQEQDFYQVHFNIREHYYLALFNLSNQDKIYKLPNALFFDNIKQKNYKGNKNITIEKRSAMCLLKISATPFALLGSKGHLFSGTEIEQIYISNNILEIEWNKNIINDMSISYRIPKNYDVALSKNAQVINKIEDNDYITLEIKPI